MRQSMSLVVGDARPYGVCAFYTDAVIRSLGTNLFRESDFRGAAE